MLRELIVIVHLDREWILIGIIVQIDEAIVQKEARVALLAIRVIDLLSTWNVLKSLNYETLSVICVRPACLTRSLMIQHISIRHKSVCLDPLDLNSENATGYHHSDFRVLFQRELTIFGHLVAYCVIVLLDVFYLLADLILKGTAFEPSALHLRVKNGEVIESLWQNINVLVEN